MIVLSIWREKLATGTLLPLPEKSIYDVLSRFDDNLLALNQQDRPASSDISFCYMSSRLLEDINKLVSSANKINWRGFDELQEQSRLIYAWLYIYNLEEHATSIRSGN